MRYIIKKHVDFDSLEYSKELVEAGLSTKVADILSKREFQGIQEQNRELFENLATRDDLEKVRLALKSDMDKLRLELKSDMDKLRLELKSDMDKLRLELKSDMDKLRLELKSDMKSLIIKFGAMMVASTAITIAALSLILHA